jgi:hypothetical protein
MTWLPEWGVLRVVWRILQTEIVSAGRVAARGARRKSAPILSTLRVPRLTASVALILKEISHLLYPISRTFLHRSIYVHPLEANDTFELPARDEATFTDWRIHSAEVDGQARIQQPEDQPAP